MAFITHTVINYSLLTINSKEAYDLRPRFPNQVLRSQLDLKPTYTGTNIDKRKIQASLVDIGREMFLHPDRRTSPTDIARERKQLLHRDKVAFLVTRYLSR